MKTLIIISQVMATKKIMALFTKRVNTSFSWLLNILNLFESNVAIYVTCRSAYVWKRLAKFASNKAERNVVVKKEALFNCKTQPATFDTAHQIL